MTLVHDHDLSHIDPDLDREATMVARAAACAPALARNAAQHDQDGSWVQDSFDEIRRALADLPPEALHVIWTTVLREFTARDRSAVLEDLEFFASHVVAIGGDSAALALAGAVEDAGTTWP
jgi:hypothetical protein